MSIIGIGCDIVDIARFAPGNVSSRLIARVFTSSEIAYCDSQRVPAQHYAARFAAKEAAVKALATVAPKLVVSQIEVVRCDARQPSLRLVQGSLSKPPPTLPGGIILHVSLSHSDAFAIATVVAEMAGDRIAGD